MNNKHLGRHNNLIPLFHFRMFFLDHSICKSYGNKGRQIKRKTEYNGVSMTGEIKADQSYFGCSVTGPLSDPS